MWPCLSIWAVQTGCNDRSGLHPHRKYYAHFSLTIMSAAGPEQNVQLLKAACLRFRLLLKLEFQKATSGCISMGTNNRWRKKGRVGIIIMLDSGPQKYFHDVQNHIDNLHAKTDQLYFETYYPVPTCVCVLTPFLSESAFYLGVLHARPRCHNNQKWQRSAD